MIQYQDGRSPDDAVSNEPVGDFCVSRACLVLDESYQGPDTDWSIEAASLWSACDGIRGIKGRRICIGCAAELARFAQQKGREEAVR